MREFSHSLRSTNLDDLLADPLIRQTMASDGVTEQDMRDLFDDHNVTAFGPPCFGPELPEARCTC